MTPRAQFSRAKANSDRYLWGRKGRFGFVFACNCSTAALAFRGPAVIFSAVLIRLILLFTVVPLLELSLLLRIGNWFGAGPTLGLVLGTGFVGAWLARREGVRAWNAVQQQLARGQVPGRELLDAVLVLLAGVVLITPGILTDAVGFTLMTRPGRNWVANRIRRRLEASVEVARIGDETDPDGPGGGRIIEL